MNKNCKRGGSRPPWAHGGDVGVTHLHKHGDSETGQPSFQLINVLKQQSRDSDAHPDRVFLRETEGVLIPMNGCEVSSQQPEGRF